MSNQFATTHDDKELINLSFVKRMWERDGCVWAEIEGLAEYRRLCITSLRDMRTLIASGAKVM